MAHKCKTCGIEGQQNFYSSHNYYCKACWNKETYRRQKQKFIDYLNENRNGVKCQRCGYDKGLWGLAFHHRDPNEKKIQH